MRHLELVALLSISFSLAGACKSDGGSARLDAALIADGSAASDVASTSDAGLADAGDAADAPADAGMIPVSRPERRDFSPALLQQLKVPSGFKVGVFASNLGNPRWMAVGPDGSVYVTINDMSQVVRLADGNGDGDSDDPGERTMVASKNDSPDLEGVHGIAINAGKVYLAALKSVVVATLGGDGRLSDFRTLIADLPDGGQHPRRTVGVGPDSKLYVSVGSDCNACPESDSQHATMLRFELDGTPSSNPPNPQHPILAANPMATISPRIFASGLRNTLGFDWNPATHELWGSDQGSDGLGDDLPPEELNRLVGGKAYGWPYCYGARAVDPVVDQPSKTVTKESYCPGTEPSTLGYQAHSSPIGFLFYGGAQFPAEYRGDAFVAFRGSWNRAVPTGYKVVRIHFAGGMPAPIGSSPVEDFLTGFLIENGAAHFGRLAGLAVDASGALLVAEDTNGIIYRVSYGAGGVDGGAGDAGSGDQSRQ
jgi:glucose/arabinose dehydrogenase